MKTARLAALSLALCTPLLAASEPGFLGGTNVTTIADGEWTDGSIWNLGSPPAAASGENARVDHDLTVTTAGAEAGGALVGANLPGSVTVSAGDLAVGSLTIGGGALTPADGAVTVTGGSVAVSSALHVGSGVSHGTLTLSGGTFVTDDYSNNHSVNGSDSGTLVVEGNGASITIIDDFNHGLRGTLLLRPTANGAAGLSTIAAGQVRFFTGEVELDFSAYTPVVGDSWDVFSYSVQVVNSAIVSAPPGYTVVEDQGTPGVIRYTVTDTPSAWTDLGNGLAGAVGTPTLAADGPLTGGSSVTLELDGAAAVSTAYLVIGLTALDAPFKGGTLVPDADLVLPIPTTGTGEIDLAFPWPAGVPAGVDTYYQYWIVDGAGPVGFSASNAVQGTTP